MLLDRDVFFVPATHFLKASESLYCQDWQFLFGELGADSDTLKGTTLLKTGSTKATDVQTPRNSDMPAMISPRIADKPKDIRSLLMGFCQVLRVFRINLQKSESLHGRCTSYVLLPALCIGPLLRISSRRVGLDSKMVWDFGWARSIWLLSGLDIRWILNYRSQSCTSLIQEYWSQHRQTSGRRPAQRRARDEITKRG